MVRINISAPDPDLQATLRAEARAYMNSLNYVEVNKDCQEEQWFIHVDEITGLTSDVQPI